MEDGNGRGVDRRFWEEAVGEGLLSVVDELISRDCRLVDPMVYPYEGPEGIKEFIGAIHDHYPRTEMEVREQSVAEDGWVIGRWRFTGSSGAKDDAPAEIVIRGTSATRVVGGKIEDLHTILNVELRSLSDGMGSWWCRIVRCK